MKKIGFIGQGWVGKHCADAIEFRGYDVVRYSLEPEYVSNREQIKECDIVFVAVPTPTTPEGFDDSILWKSLACIAPGTTVVIKSTVMPDTVERLQEGYPDLFVMHSPEFLTERNAAHDAAHPSRNIVGIPRNDPRYRFRALEVLEVLPVSPVTKVCNSRESALIKYGANCFLYLKVVYANMIEELAAKMGCSYKTVRAMIGSDPRIGKSHLEIDLDGGRGAGGDCFIKDFEAFIEAYRNEVGNNWGVLALEGFRDKNIDLLQKSGKDLELLKGVYGESIEFPDA